MCEHLECEHSLGPSSHCRACELSVLEERARGRSVSVWPGRVLVWARMVDHLGGYHDRCVHSRALTIPCVSCDAK